ncbi:Small RNA degrading nuclease 2, partial [Globisporangium splendens]
MLMVAPVAAAVAGGKKRKLSASAASAAAPTAHMSKKQRVEHVASIAKDVMINLLTSDLSYDATDAEYEKLVTLTQAHPNFKKFYTFPSSEEKGWVKTKSKKKSSHLRIVAVDCEMCVIAPYSRENDRVSNALCRVSAVDGDDMIRSIISDYIVHQPEKGYRMLDPKTDIHGITPEMIAQSKISVAKAQKQLLKYINSDTILVGHSLHGDLKSLRIDHTRVIDTAMIYQRKGGDPLRNTPGLKCLTKFLLNFEMPDGHDSTIDAQASMLAAKYAVRNPTGAIIPSSLELHGPKERPERPERPVRAPHSGPAEYQPTAFDLSLVTGAAPATESAAVAVATSVAPAVAAVPAAPVIKSDAAVARSCRLRLHRIPKGVSSHDIESFFVQHAKIVPSAVEAIKWLPNQNRGSCNVTFATETHAALAFETVQHPETKHQNKITLDSIGRRQKTVAITSSKGTVFSNVQLGVM